MEGNRYSNLSFSEKIRHRFDWSASGRLLVCSVVIGCLTGLCSSGLYTVLLEIKAVVPLVYHNAGIDLPQPHDYTATTGPLPGKAFEDAARKDTLLGIALPRYWILLLLVPALGGLLCGLFVRVFSPDSSGDPTDHTIKAFHTRNGFLRNRIPLTKTFTSFLTLGSGGSAGFEGPLKLFGAWLAHCLSKGLQFNHRDKRTLMLAGASGAVGSLFQVPLGGAFFAVEILYASTALELSAILPCILASVVGWSVFRYIHGDVHFFAIPEAIGIHSPLDSMLFLLFVPFIALAGALFVLIVRELRYRIFQRLSIPYWFQPALGGLMLGCIALIFPQVLGGGYEWFPALVHGTLPFLLIVSLILPKMLATALTLSSGGSGGFLAPSLFIGGLIGGTLGHLTHYAFGYFSIPHQPPDMTMCVLVGMSVFYAGIAKMPYAAAIIVCEMSGFHYEFLIPLLILNLLHMGLQSPSTSLYEEQVLTPIDSEAHFGHYSSDLLRVLSVQDVLSEQKEASTCLFNSMPIVEAVKLIAPKPDSAFPVLDGENKFVGMVDANDIWRAFQHWEKWRNQSITSLTETEPLVISPEENLYIALRKCMLEHITELPVLSEEQPDVLLGIIRQSDILATYNNRLSSVKWE